MAKGNFKYGLEEILLLAIACSVSGLTNYEEMQEYGACQLKWFRTFYPYKHGMPLHDTINRLFVILEPDEFSKYCVERVAVIRKYIYNESITIDGKVAKGSVEPLRIHIGCWTFHSKRMLHEKERITLPEITIWFAK